MLKFYSKQVVFQEVPNEISISFSIAGCPLKCPGCSWKTAVSSMLEKQLTDEYYYKALEEYKIWLPVYYFTAENGINKI